MSDDSADTETSARYYATKSEQQLLIWGLRQYFSYPERSVNRNKIAATVTGYLKNISPHWTHRAVRLWFNNNKKNFFNDPMTMFPQYPMQMMPMVTTQPYVGVPAMSPQVLQSSPQVVPLPQIQPSPPQPLPIPTTQTSNLITQTGPASTNISGIPNDFSKQHKPNKTNPQKPPHKSKQSQQSSPPQVNVIPSTPISTKSPLPIPETSPIVQPPKPLVTPQINTQIAPPKKPAPPPIPNINMTQLSAASNNQPPPHPLPQPVIAPIIPQQPPQKSAPSSSASKLLLPPIRPPPPSKVHFDSQPNTKSPIPMPSIANPLKPQPSPPPAFPQPSIYPFIKQSNSSLYLPSTPPSEYSELSQLVKKIRLQEDFKNIVGFRDEFDAKCQHIISVDGVCLSEKIDYGVNFIKLRNSGEASNDDMLIEMPSDFCIPQKSYSFLDTDSLFHTTSQPDLISVKPVFQDRRFKEYKVGSYDKVCITHSYATYTTNDFISPQKVIFFMDLTDDSNNWGSFHIPTNLNINAFHADARHTYSFTDSHIYKTEIRPNAPSVQFDFPKSAQGIPYMATDRRNGQIVIGFSQSPSMYFLGNDLVEQQTPYNGFTSLMCFNDNIMCVPNNSFSIRQMTRSGKEVSSHIGHTNFVRQLIQKDENLFISMADDNTVRLWDVRQALPTVQISCSASCICQDGNYIILGLQKQGLAVFDVRSSAIKVCVTTQDYIAESISYNAAKDELFMFGMIGRDGCKESMIFIDNDGNSRKRVFRKYHNFAAISN